MVGLFFQQWRVGFLNFLRLGKSIKSHLTQEA
jgi:hypothetical protein